MMTLLTSNTRRHTSPLRLVTRAIGTRLDALREKLSLEGRDGGQPTLSSGSGGASSSSSALSAVGAIAAPLQPLPPWHDGAVTPASVRSLYRHFWRKSASMPTINRRNYIRRKVADEFRDALEERDPERIEFLYRLGETQLETVHVQAEHLRSMTVDPY